MILTASSPRWLDIEWMAILVNPASRSSPNIRSDDDVHTLAYATSKIRGFTCLPGEKGTCGVQSASVSWRTAQRASSSCRQEQRSLPPAELHNTEWWRSWMGRDFDLQVTDPCGRRWGGISQDGESQVDARSPLSRSHLVNHSSSWQIHTESVSANCTTACLHYWS